MEYYFDKELIDEHAPGARCIKAMKASKFEPEMTDAVFNSGDYVQQLKVDGFWYQYEKTANGDTYLFSRNVSKQTGILTEKVASIPYIDEIFEEIPNDTIIIGEIFVDGGTSKDVTKIMGCSTEKAIERQEETLVRFYIHDIIYFNGEDLRELGYIDRYEILKKLFYQYYMNHVGDVVLAKNEEPSARLIVKWISEGKEGAILKHKFAPYEPDKRPKMSMVKIKKSDSLDVVFMGTVPATKEYTGKELETWKYWGGRKLNSAFYAPTKKQIELLDLIPVTKGHYYMLDTAIRFGLYDNEGNLVEIGTVSSGLSDSNLEDITVNSEKYVGRVLAINCMEVDPSAKTVRHPVFDMFRDDKPASDCTIKSVFGDDYYERYFRQRN